MSFFRSQSTIQAWIDEFVALHYPLSGTIRVLEQDGTGGGNTGLVMVELDHLSISTTIQPREIGSPWWVVSFEARDSVLSMNPSDVMSLAGELTTVSALCAFLEAKSTAYLENDED